MECKNRGYVSENERNLIERLAQSENFQHQSGRIEPECSRYYPCDSEYEEALFIADVLRFDMEAGISLLEQCGLVRYHDSISQISNYAVMLTDMVEPQVGLSALQKLARDIKKYNSDVSSDYAFVQEAMGNIYLSIGDVPQATKHLNKALAVYEVLFRAEPELIEKKKQDILAAYAQVVVNLGRQLFQI